MLLAVAVALALLLRPVVARYLSAPVGLLYAVAAGYLESLPQIYFWAILVGALLLVGLRQVRLSAGREQTAARAAHRPQGRLGNWLRLLDERERGAYFDWRLAHRLAELQDWIEARGPADPQQQIYLRIGRDRRTIEAEHQLSRLNLELDPLVAYLEDAFGQD